MKRQMGRGVTEQMSTYSTSRACTMNRVRVGLIISSWAFVALGFFVEVHLAAALLASLRVVGANRLPRRQMRLRSRKVTEPFAQEPDSPDEKHGLVMRTGDHQASLPPWLV